MKAYLRVGSVEHALVAPLSTSLSPICDHIPRGGRPRTTFDRIARLDRERTPGEHVFPRVELLELAISAHGLMCDPPVPIRKLRRLAVGPLPAADRIAELREWLAARVELEVVYDLWRSATPRS